MKKLFLILSAAVALSSLAFAKPYGEKSRPDSAGDIVFADGTATAWREGLTLTDAQKAAAVAVIFYAGTECSDDGRERLLGVGLAHELGGLEWCTKDANAYSKNITTIQCPASGNEENLTFTGTKDGSESLSKIGAFLAKKRTDDTADESHYPAFYFAKNYAEAEGSNVRGTEFESGWYLPSLAELYQIWKNIETVNAAIWLCDGSSLFGWCYWSSSQYAPEKNLAYAFNFTDGDWGYTSKYATNIYVCAVRAFN